MRQINISWKDINAEECRFVELCGGVVLIAVEPSKRILFEYDGQILGELIQNRMNWNRGINNGIKRLVRKNIAYLLQLERNK